MAKAATAVTGGMTEGGPAAGERHLSSADLPVIDISRFVNGDEAERSAAAEEWDAAFVQVGFCQLKGYESILDEATIGALRETATDFFVNTPHEQKMRSHVDGEIGYLAVGEENVAATLGEPNPENDLVEGIELSGYGGGWRSAPSCEVPWSNASYALALPGELKAAAEAYWQGGRG